MADAVTLRTYEKYLIVDTAGDMRIVSRMPQLGAREVAYTIKVHVPITRIPIPAGTIELRMPEMRGAQITVQVEDHPVEIGGIRKHKFASAELDENARSRCGLDCLNVVHKCIAPDCKFYVAVEHDGIGYCTNHNPGETAE